MRTRQSVPPGAGEETLVAEAAPLWFIKSDDINTGRQLLKAYCVPGPV